MFDKNEKALKSMPEFLRKEIDNRFNADSFDADKFIQEFQEYIEKSGCNIIAVVEAPNGANMQFNNKGMPLFRSIGLLEITLARARSAASSDIVFDCMNKAIIQSFKRVDENFETSNDNADS